MPTIMRRAIQMVVFLCALPLSTPVFAISETLTFRLGANGDVLAVISGMGGLCTPMFVAPSSISIVGFNIAITSTPAPIVCPLPPPPRPYEEIANLGQLAPGTYQVTWTAGTLSISGVVTPGAIPPFAAPVPALSSFGVALMSLFIAFMGVHSLARRSRGP